jgi:hypothetical protein
VDVWIRGIKLAIESRISLSVNLYWIIKKSDMDNKWSLDHIMWRSIVTGVAHVKIMLIPSSFDKDENGTKKNQVDKFKFILICFISLLSIGRHTIKRDAIWWSWQNQSAQNTERFHEWCKKTKFQEYAEICHTGQTGIAHWSDRFDLSKSKSGPFTGFQSRLPDMSGIGLD